MVLTGDAVNLLNRHSYHRNVLSLDCIKELFCNLTFHVLLQKDFLYLCAGLYRLNNGSQTKYNIIHIVILNSQFSIISVVLPLSCPQVHRRVLGCLQ